MNDRPNKHVFIPPPLTENERIAWQLADANSQAIQQLQAENAELRRLTDRHDRDWMESQKQVDRLRELLRDAQQVLGTALVTLQEYDVYRKFPVTAAKWAELREKINAELAKGSK